MLRLHCLQHQPHEGPAHILTSASRRGWQVSHTPLYDARPLPRFDDFDLLVIMGGSMNVYETFKYPWFLEEKDFIANAISQEKKILGICLGAQLIADVLDAPIRPNIHKEIGWFPILRLPDSIDLPILDGLPPSLYTLHWHADTFDIPDGAVRIAESDGCANQGFVYDDRVVALQFHVECTPESQQALLDTLDGSSEHGPFVQTREEIERLGREHMAAAQQALERLLDNLSNT